FLHATTLPPPDGIVWRFPPGVFTLGKPYPTDLWFSGHTANAFVIALATRGGPLWLRAVAWLGVAFEIVLVLATRTHYTIDVHGFFPDPASPASHVLWRAALLAIGVAALGACAAAAHLGLRERVARRVVRLAMLELVVYAAIVLSGDRPFAVAVCEYLPAALFLLAVLIARFARRREATVLVGAAGLGLTFVASGLQQAGIGLHPRWFNHNALYHLLEGIALATLYWCARALDRRT